MAPLSLATKMDSPLRDTARAARLGEQWLASLPNRGLDDGGGRFFLSESELEILEFILDDVAKRAEGLVALLDTEADLAMVSLNRRMREARP